LILVDIAIDWHPPLFLQAFSMVKWSSMAANPCKIDSILDQPSFISNMIDRAWFEDRPGI